MDMDRQDDEAWILSVQCKLYQWSQANPGDNWRDMWGWLTDIRTLRCAWRRAASNRGARTAGVDGITVGASVPNRVNSVSWKNCKLNCAQAHFSPVHPDGCSSPRQGNRGNSDLWVFPRSRIASFKARSKSYWSLSSKRSFGMSPTGFGPDETATGLWSISAELPCRSNATRITGGAGCPINGLLRVTSRAALTISRTTT